MRSRSQPEWFDAEAADEVPPALSTSSAAFAAILDGMVREVDGAPVTAPEAVPDDVVPAPDPEPRHALVTSASASDPASDSIPLAPAPPVLLRGSGDLVLVLGLGGDALAAARRLADDAEADILPVADRNEALAARAEGVRRGRAVVGVVALACLHAVSDLAPTLAAIAPDQVWVAVDASRRLEDTTVWVRAVDAVLAVDAVAAHSVALTTTPWALQALALPVLWLDAPPPRPARAVRYPSL